MRIKLEIPEKILFCCKIILRIDDMNYGNHMGNERILVLAHESRVQFLKSLDCSEFDLFGASIIQADAAITYKSEGQTGDVIICNISIENVGRSSFEMYYHFFNETSQQSLAVCKTGMVFYDYSNQKVCATPVAFEQLFL
jgi:acyl-CoA thioester hydrolase